MARDGLFFPALASLHPRFQTPVLAIALQAAWAAVLLLTGTYGDLVDSVVFADWIFFGLTVAGLFVFRGRPSSGSEAGGFRAPGYPVLPALFVAAAALVVWSAIRSNPTRSALGAALLAAGVPIYFAFARRAARKAA
jgi:APA family basic amino acid/polyamine antiporter